MLFGGAFVAEFRQSDNDDLDEVVETITKDESNGDKDLSYHKESICVTTRTFMIFFQI